MKITILSKYKKEYINIKYICIHASILVVHFEIEH
jgi:hypothetical protein